MKTKLLVVMIVVVLLSLLVGCQAQVPVSTTVATQSTTSSTLSLNTLLYGMLALENTENTLTSDQLNSMLFYWKGVKTLNSSDNVSSEETEALKEQIYNTFSIAQKDYIGNLDLSAETIQSLSVYLSIDQTASVESDITINQSGPGGGPMGGNGGMPSGGDDMGSIMSGGMQMQGNTSTSGDQLQTADTRLDDTTIEAVIQYLEGKVGA